MEFPIKDGKEAKRFAGNNLHTSALQMNVLAKIKWHETHLFEQHNWNIYDLSNVLTCLTAIWWAIVFKNGTKTTLLMNNNFGTKLSSVLCMKRVWNEVRWWYLAAITISFCTCQNLLFCVNNVCYVYTWPVTEFMGGKKENYCGQQLTLVCWEHLLSFWPQFKLITCFHSLYLFDCFGWLYMKSQVSALNVYAHSHSPTDRQASKNAQSQTDTQSDTQQ